MDLSKLSDEDLKALASNRFDAISERGLRIIAGQTEKQEKGLGAALKGGASRLASTVQTGIESLFDAEGAARRGLEREEEISRRYAPATSLEAVKKAYTERGLLPAAGEVVSQIPGAVTEQAPQIATTLGAARLGAMAGSPFGPVGAIIGGTAGAIAPSFLQLFGSNIQRQAEEGRPVSAGRAAAAAAPGAALEVAATFVPLGRSLVGKLLGPEAEKALAKGGSKVVDEGLAKVLTKGAAVGAGFEIPTEVTQQMLERLQAGLPLSSPDALAEYGEAAYGAGLVGGPFGAVGRVGQRAVARGERDKEVAEQRKLDEQIAAKEREATEKAETERKLTPEFRQELNDKIYTLKDELAQVEPIAKDKAQDEDVRNEAIARAKEIKAELKTLQEQFKESMRQAGLTPTLAQAKAAGPRVMPVVDEFGNIVKPKGKQLTEEEYGAKLEAAANQWNQTREKIFELREKELAEKEAKKEKTAAQVEKQVQGYLRSLDEYDRLIEEADVKARLEKGLPAREKAAKEATFERAMERIQKAIDNFGFNLIGYESSSEVQRLKTQIADLSRPESIAAAEDRDARLQQIDTLKAELDAAIQNAPRDSGEGLRRSIDEGRVTRDVTGALGIKGLGGRTVSAAEALPNIEERINELEEKRAEFTKRIPETSLMKDDGTLTASGVRLVKNEVKLNELKRLRTVAGQAEETGAEAPMVSAMEGATRPEPPAVLIKSGLPSVTYKSQADKAATQASGRFTDLTALMDDYRKGRFFGEKGAKRDIQLASYTREGLLRESEEARSEITDRLIEEIAYRRMEQGLRPFTKKEAQEFALNADNIFAEIIRRSTALPSGYSLEKIYTPAKTRGTEIIESARESLIDTRDLKDRQFGAPQRAMEVLGEMINQAKQQAIEAGQREVRADKGTLQLLKTPREAAPTDLVQDLDRVLRMENLQPDVRNTLEQARSRMEEGGISAELEELIDEQVGRILRGTDRPFVLERDVTKPGGRRAIAGAGTAELIDEIKTQMRFDSELAQYAQGEQRTLVPQGKRFVEAEVQPSLFPETEATVRATPAQFQRLQKAKPVQAAREAAAKQREIEQAELKEKQRKAREAAQIKAETAPARQVEAQMQAVRDVFNEVASEYTGKKQAQRQDKVKQLTMLMKTVRTKALKQLNEITNPASKRRFIKDVEEDLAFYFPKEAKLISQVQAQLKKIQEVDTNRLAILDKRVQNEVKFLKTLEKRAALAEQGTPEQRKAQKQAALVRGQILKAEQIIKEAKEAAADRASEQEALRRTGLDLPGIRVTAERRELAKGKGVVRRPKIVPIKTKAEVEELKAEQRAERFDINKPLEKDQISAVLAKIERLSGKERTTQTKLYLEAAADAKRAQTELEKYIKNLRGKEANKDRIRALRDEVDETSKIVRELNRRIVSEVSATLKGVEEPAVPIRKATTRGPVKGEVPFYDKKFTPDQLRNMSGLGLNAFEGTKTYSVDDSIDFAIGDSEGGGISLEEANARMAEVEKKLPDTVKFKYFPTMGDVTADILKQMSRQGVDIYTTRIRGGVKPDGTVFVIGENHTDLTDLNKTIAHEFIGHYTFEGMLGPDGMRALLKRVDKAFGNVYKLADQLGVGEDATAAYVQAKNFGATDAEANLKALREVIAYTMEKRVDQPFLQKAKRWIQELVGAARSFLRKMGVDLDLSTNDLFYMMKQANEAFESGKPIAYKKTNGDIDFALSKPKYAPGTEELGDIADRIIGRQKGFMDKVKANTMGLAGRVQFVDRWAALEELVNRGVSRGIIDSLKAADVMYFARMADQRHAFVAEVANNGSLKLKEIKRPDGQIEKVIESERGDSLKDVSEALASAGVGDPEATGRLFTLYLAAERASRVGLNKLNYSGKITEADLKKALDFGRGNAAFQKARKLYNEYNKGLIDFAVKMGAIDKKLGEKLKATNDYVPYYRMKGGVVDLIIGSEQPIRIGDVKNQPYLEELVGGDEAIMDFFTSSLQNTTLLTDMALRNMATYQAANTLKDLGVAQIKPGDGPASSNVIRFKYNGEKYYAEIDTQAKEDMFGDIPPDLIVKGMEGIKIIVPGIVRGLAGPANILRKFVTRDPRYAVRQVFRDSMAAVFTTGANMVPVVDTLGQIAKMGKSEAYQKLQRRGVLGGQVITGAPEDMQKVMQQLTSGKPGWELAMAKLDQWAQAGDAATRMSMYNSFLKQGLSEREATLASLESMNFGRRGVSPSIYFLNATVPFFNAGIQGLDVLYRAYKGKMPYNEQLKIKQKLIARGLMMAAFTATYAAMMQDDEAYKKAQPEQRYGNWFIRIPGFSEPFRVPIPFDVGLVFKAIPEGLYNAAFSDEKGSKIAKDLATQLMRTLPGSPAEAGVPIPAAVKPFIEIALNKSFFTGRDIVDARLEGMEKQYQYRDKTPEVLKLLAPVTSMLGLSPVQLETLIRGYTGSLGMGILSVVNPVLSTQEAGPTAPKGITDMPYIGPLIGGLFQPNDAGRVIDDAYDSMREIQGRQRTYRKLIEEGQIDEAQQFLKDNIADVGLASFAGQFRQQMGQITKAERAVRAAPGSQMSPEEKREQLDKLRDLKNTLSKNFTDVREQIGRQAARQ